MGKGSRLFVEEDMQMAYEHIQDKQHHEPSGGRQVKL